jgi:hypothetical protein
LVGDWLRKIQMVAAVGEYRAVEELGQHVGAEVELAGVALLGADSGEGEAGGEGSGGDADGGGGLIEGRGELEAGAGGSEAASDEDAEEVGAADGGVAAVGEEAAEFVGAGDLVVDLGDGGVDLERGGHDLLGDVLMEPEDLPAGGGIGVGGELAELGDFREHADELGGDLGRLLCVRGHGKREREEERPEFEAAHEWIVGEIVSVGAEIFLGWEGGTPRMMGDAEEGGAITQVSGTRDGAPICLGFSCAMR